MPGKKGKKKAAPKRRQAGGRRRMLKGDGIFDSIGNWFKGAANTVYNKAVRPAYDKVIRPTYDKALRPAYDFARDNKLISKGLGAIGTFVPGPVGTIAKVGSAGAALGGLGKRRRMNGGAIGTERLFGVAISN